MKNNTAKMDNILKDKRCGTCGSSKTCFSCKVRVWSEPEKKEIDRKYAEMVKIITERNERKERAERERLEELMEESHEIHEQNLYQLHYELHEYFGVPKEKIPNILPRMVRESDYYTCDCCCNKLFGQSFHIDYMSNTLCFLCASIECCRGCGLFCGGSLCRGCRHDMF